MQKNIVFILENGITENAKTSYNPFLFDNKELVSFQSGQKVYIYKNEENNKWKYIN